MNTEDMNIDFEQADGFIAAQPETKARPAFTVKKLQGTVPHTVHIFDKKENKIKSKVIQEDAGYLVTFAKGHSVRARDLEHLRQMGAGMRMIPVVDQETGEVKGHVPNKVAA